jgi:hypothetical protein
MAKETHVAQATNFRGIVLAKRHFTFQNAREGYEKLQRWMDELQQKHRLKTVIIGMEPTGMLPTVGAQISMSRRGNCLDNAATLWSFFRFASVWWIILNRIYYGCFSSPKKRTS